MTAPNAPVGPDVPAGPDAPVGPDVPAGPDVSALAWHDVTCPEGPECRSRSMHATSEPVARSGVLARFLDRRAELSRPADAVEHPGEEPGSAFDRAWRAEAERSARDRLAGSLENLLGGVGQSTVIKPLASFAVWVVSLDHNMEARRRVSLGDIIDRAALSLSLSSRALGSGASSAGAPSSRPRQVTLMSGVPGAPGRLGEAELDYSCGDDVPCVYLGEDVACALEDMRFGAFWTEAAAATKTTGPNGRGWTVDTPSEVLSALHAWVLGGRK